MRNGSQEPRSRLIIRRTNEARVNVLKFATAVAEHYMAAVAPDDRIMEFHTSSGSMDSALAAQKNNGHLVDHILKGVTRFPVDLEESWIAALPDPYRGDLIRELAQRYGLIGAQLPAVEPHEHVARIADVLRDAGRTAQLVAPMFGTGKLDVRAETAQHIAHALMQIDRSIDDLISFKEQIKAQLPTPPKSKR
jgi:hypothetical protein